MMRSVLLLLLAAGLPGAAAAQRPFKVDISADMEGIDGVASRLQSSPAGAEYQKYRRLMTLEVNAGVEGAYLAGATEVVVGDSHGNAQNIDHELLDQRAILIRAWPRALGMVHGIDSSFAAEILVLMHEVRRIDGQTVVFEGADMLDAARFFEVVHHIRPPE